MFREGELQRDILEIFQEAQHATIARSRHVWARYNTDRILAAKAAKKALLERDRALQNKIRLRPLMTKLDPMVCCSICRVSFTQPADWNRNQALMQHHRLKHG